MTTVVGIGSCGIDYFAIVPHLLGPDEKINVERIEIHAGGVTGNNLTQVARLGAKAGWLGLIGNDESGRLITRAFAEDGLDLSGIEVITGVKSTFTWIPVDVQGERSIYMFPNVNGKLSAEQVRTRFAGHIVKARHFHTEASQLPLPPVREGMRIAHEAGVRVIFDLDVAPSYFAQARLGTEKDLVETLQLADVLKPCKAAAREITGETDYKKMAAKLLTLGPKIVAGERKAALSPAPIRWITSLLSMSAWWTPPEQATLSWAASLTACCRDGIFRTPASSLMLARRCAAPKWAPARWASAPRCWD